MRLATHLGIIHYFQHFCKSAESTLGGGGNPVVHFQKMLVLATVPVHETTLANQHFYSRILERRWGYVKVYAVYTCENAENYGWSLTYILRHNIY